MTTTAARQLEKALETIDRYVPSIGDTAWHQNGDAKRFIAAVRVVLAELKSTGN